MDFNKGVIYGGLVAMVGILFYCIFGKSGGGIPPGEIVATYTRPETNINIVITNSQAYYGHGDLGPDFSSTEISLMETALDSLTSQQIIQSGVTVIMPAPQSLHDEGKWGPTIILDPNDPNLITHFLTLLGFPPPKAASSKSPTAAPSAPIVSSQGSVATKTPLDVRGIEVLSSHSPSDYVPVTSPTGLQSVLDDSNMVKNNKGQNKQLTLHDQVRPHGNVLIVPSDTQQN